MSNLSLRKFALLSKARQHAYAADWLKKALKDPRSSFFRDYLQICQLLHLPPIPFTPEALSDRFHDHSKEAQLHPKEHEFLPLIKTGDQPSNTPFLPIWIYLDNLRLAQNAGSIIRTTEAFRLGSICFGGNTPFIDQSKVQAAAMGSDKIVPCTQEKTDLPRPFIGLETVENATPIFEYKFPKNFTLVIGNEEYGISKDMLGKCADFVQIPLVGQKNSINVACAFAITAAAIRSNYNKN